MFSLLSDSRVLKERNPPLERINSLRLADRSSDVVSSVADEEEEEGGGDAVLGSRYEDGSNLMAGCAYAMPTPPPPDAVDRPPRSYGIGGDGP